MTRIGHQHTVPAREAEVGGQRRALVAALFLDDLDQQHLAALDDVLDLVTAAQRHALGAQFVGLGGGAIAATLPAASAPAAPIFAVAVFAAAVIPSFIGLERALDVAVLDRRDVFFFVGVDFDQPAKIIVMVMIVRAILTVFGTVFAVVFVARIAFVTVVDGAQRGLFLGVRGFFGEQCLAVFLGDLVIVGMDLAEGQKPVPVAAKIDECSLQRGFDPGYLGEVDVAFDLLVFSRFKVKFFNPVAFEHRHPGFFRVARID